VLEEIAEKLQRDILEGKSRAVEKLQHRDIRATSV
jgi:hypothetical protein